MLKDLLKVANKLDALGLTKEARILSSIVKSAGDDTDAPLIVEDTSNWTTDPDPEETPTQGGKLEDWIFTNGAEYEAWKMETHKVGFEAWKECEELGGDKEDCQRAYTLAIYRKEFGRDPEM